MCAGDAEAVLVLYYDSDDGTRYADKCKVSSLTHSQCPATITCSVFFFRKCTDRDTSPISAFHKIFCHTDKRDPQVPVFYDPENKPILNHVYTVDCLSYRKV